MTEEKNFKIVVEDSTFEFNVLKPKCIENNSISETEYYENEEKFFDLVEEDLNLQIEELNKKISIYTNNADTYDYIVAVCSGVFAGLLDIFFVGDFNFEGAKKSIDKAFNDFVNKKAKDIKVDEAINNARKKYEKKGEKLTKEKIAEIKTGIEKEFKENPNLSSSIKTLEKKYKIPSDSLWNGKDNGISAKSHHLDDLAHHPTIIGLTVSIICQFMKEPKGIFQNSEGVFFTYDVENKELIGKDLKSKLICGVINWIGHLISDMAGSNSSARKGTPGMGLPGPFVSTLKELSMLPIFKKMKFSELANHLFTNDNAIFDKYRLDLRSELAIGKELVRQSIPIFLNEIIIRSFYFIRRFIINAKTATSIGDIPWREVIPVGNRTIERMNTISLATMEGLDITDAAIRGAMTANVPMFFKTFALRVNYVGICSFAIACTVDTGMGVERQKLLSQRIKLYDEKIKAKNGILYFKEADMWISAEKAGIAIDEAYQMIDVAEEVVNDSFVSIKNNLDKIGESIDQADEMNPGLRESLLDTLKWGI